MEISSAMDEPPRTSGSLMATVGEVTMSRYDMYLTAIGFAVGGSKEMLTLMILASIWTFIARSWSSLAFRVTGNLSRLGDVTIFGNAPNFPVVFFLSV